MNRLDNELVSRNLVSSRSKAKSFILEGLIYCDGKKIKKPSFIINENTFIEIKGNIMPYVSRGGLKLEKAIDSFKLDFKDKIVLDIGSSTGGFTDCSLQKGASKVIAVDVGKDQMVNELRDNKRVKLYEQMDFRTIEKDKIEDSSIIVMDVSFISTKLLLERIKELENVKEIVCLIKPQFECGKEVADKYKGIILNKDEHIKVLNNVLKNFKEIDFYCNGLITSPIRGKDGNIEYLGYFTKEKIKNINVNDVAKKTFE